MEKSQKMSDWLTPQQYADKYQVHVKTVRRWVSEGQIKAKKYGPLLIRIYDPKEQAR